MWNPHKITHLYIHLTRLLQQEPGCFHRRLVKVLQHRFSPWLPLTLEAVMTMILIHVVHDPLHCFTSRSLPLWSLYNNAVQGCKELSCFSWGMDAAHTQSSHTRDPPAVNRWRAPPQGAAWWGPAPHPSLKPWSRFQNQFLWPSRAAAPHWCHHRGSWTSVAVDTHTQAYRDQSS